METKTFEVRDRATFIPVLAVRLHAEPQEPAYYLLRRCGYDTHQNSIHVMLMRLNGDGRACNDPYDWGNSRTMTTAHDWIIRHWTTLKDGGVVDVETILGERKTPKLSERFGG